MKGGVPCLCPGRQKGGQHMKVTIVCLLIQDDITYVDALGDTWMQFDGGHAIDMGLLYVVRTSNFYTQLSRVMHLVRTF